MSPSDLFSVQHNRIDGYFSAALIINLIICFFASLLIGYCVFKSKAAAKVKFGVSVISIVAAILFLIRASLTMDGIRFGL